MIAVLGYGSLIWDLDGLAPHVEGGWAMNAGPALPMEFSRISAKRKRGLVVCLDPADGVDCPTHAIRSRRSEIGQAASDLAQREHAPLGRIGYVCLSSDRAAGRLPSICAAVAVWCRQAGWQGAVWTDLEPNFASEAGQPFSVPRGLAYLRALSGESRSEAVRYIACAPHQTDTPLRQALAGLAWWADARRELGV
ncbi:MAG: hypothetical protein AAFR46_11160 [Pseudomonadota bacterium]